MLHRWPDFFGISSAERLLTGVSWVGLVIALGAAAVYLHRHASASLLDAARKQIGKHHARINEAQYLFHTAHVGIAAAARASLAVPSASLRHELGEMLDEMAAIVRSVQVVEKLRVPDFTGFGDEVRGMIDKAAELHRIALEPPAPEAGAAGQAAELPPLTTVAEALAFLGLDATATREAMEKTIKRRLMKYHPDHNGQMSDSPQVFAALQAETQRVLEARDILRIAKLIK